MRHQFEAVLFDLDGTLIDSEGNYQQADSRFLASHGIDLTPEMTAEFVGMGSLSMINKIIRDYSLNGDPLDYLKQKDDIYLQIAQGHTNVYPEMIKLLNFLKREGIPMAVASGSSLRVIKESVRITEIDGFFSHLVSADEVPKGKPAPDVFLEAASRLGADPKKCLVLEDSKHGVNSAKAAGMTCVAIPTLVSEETPELFKGADILYTKGMESFSLTDLLARLKLK